MTGIDCWYAVYSPGSFLCVCNKRVLYTLGTSSFLLYVCTKAHICVCVCVCAWLCGDQRSIPGFSPVTLSLKLELIGLLILSVQWAPWTVHPLLHSQGWTVGMLLYLVVFLKTRMVEIWTQVFMLALQTLYPRAFVPSNLCRSLSICFKHLGTGLYSCFKWHCMDALYLIH